MKIPILTYNSTHIDGSDYRSNDLKALAADLRQVTEAGFQIVPLYALVEAWLSNDTERLNGKLVAFACDHGSDFDHFDLPHPKAGIQRSVLNTLRDFEAEHRGAQPHLNITSFVIVSPEARDALDRTCLVGQGWWTDGWWRHAIESGFIHIASNSWDHHHDSLPASFSLGVKNGTFLTIDTQRLADHEIRQAAEYLREVAPNPGTRLFAYPYGEANLYLATEYFPGFGADLGVTAAFTARPGFFRGDSRRWEIPRFIFGRDWSSPSELQEILDAASSDQESWRPKSTRSRASKLQAGAETKMNSHNADPHASTSAEGFRARFEMVPKYVMEWIARERSTEALDILDFGCGEGISALGLALNHKPRRVVGIDIGPDPEQCLPIARAQIGITALPGNLEFHRVGAGFLHSDDERFDVIYSWSAFEHVDERLIGRTLDLVKSSLRPNGLFLVQIAPLYYSAEGAHLFHKIPEPWGHLLHQHSALHEQLVAAVPDRDELLTLWGTYRTLNRLTERELVNHLENAGFHIVRQWAEKDRRVPPARLSAIYTDDVLTTPQILILAKPS